MSFKPFPWIVRAMPRPEHAAAVGKCAGAQLLIGEQAGRPAQRRTMSTTNSKKSSHAVGSKPVQRYSGHITCEPRPLIDLMHPSYALQPCRHERGRAGGGCIRRSTTRWRGKGCSIFQGRRHTRLKARQAPVPNPSLRAWAAFSGLATIGNAHSGGDDATFARYAKKRTQCVHETCPCWWCWW